MTDQLAESTAAPEVAPDDLAEFLGLEIEEEQEAPEPDEGEGNEDPDEGQDEPETAIDPPASWAKDAQEIFKQLPPDLQATVSEREAQREAFVRTKANEAVTAKRDAETQAQTALAERETFYANELGKIAAQFAPQRPDPAILQSDPQLFYAMEHAYQDQIAQLENIRQQEAGLLAQAQQRQAAVDEAERQANIAQIAQTFPEFADPVKWQATITEIVGVGLELGFDGASIQEATASELKALKTAAEWKAGYEKLKSIQKANMAKVRAAKGGKTATPGTVQTQGEVSAARSQSAWQRTKVATSRDEKANAFADYLSASGIV